jgi:hypothetical protein
MPMLIVLIKLVQPLKQDEGILEYNFTVLCVNNPNIMYASW